MRIYTIKGETQLSKSPQILVAYPRASESVRPCKLFLANSHVLMMLWYGRDHMHFISAHLRSSALLGVNTCPAEWNSGV